MTVLVVVIDSNNFLVKGILKKLIKYAKPSIWSYEEMLSRSKKDNTSKKVFYLTPAGDKILVSKVKKLIKDNRLKVINSLDLQLFDKPQFDEIFARNNINYPDSILTKSSAEAVDFISKHETAIIKLRNDCGGSGHFIVNDRYAYSSGGKKYFLNFLDGCFTERREIFRKNLFVSPPFYIQKFIIPDNHSVWRAYIVGSEVKFFSTRKRDFYENLGDYIINVAKGAKYYFPDGDHEVEKLCDKFAKSINLEIGAIDFIFHKGVPYFLEVNCEGVWFLICRKFYESPYYNSKKHNLDKFITEHLGEFDKKA